MAITRGSERDLLFPGLADIIMAYPEIPKQWPGVFDQVGSSKMALERVVEMRPVGLAQLKAEGGAWDGRLSSIMWCGAVTALAIGGESTVDIAEV